MTSPISPDSLQHIQPEPLTLEEMNLEESISLTPSTTGELPTEFQPQQQFPLLRKILGYLTKVQKYTGYMFTTFAGLHLASVVITPGLGISMAKSQDMFELARTIYLQIPGFEFMFVTGATVAHVLSGVGIRMIRNHIRYQTRTMRPTKNDTPILTDSERDDIGLGGITGLIGLGYRKAWISRLIPELSPLAFSGYLLIPIGLLHYFEFRWSPMIIDGDSSLISLQYITHVLHFEAWPYQNVLNFAGLVGLVWLGSYHMVSGLWKIRRRYSARDKKLGYFIINILTALSVVSLYRFQRGSIDTGFMGKQFTKYLRYFLW
ncbi:hypothetical protein CAAN1_18S02344 [[Candida] anglica]|uniref:Mitochondrial adapter protein MCP1 transmembrane domain-containing protein n=1 Tax=[Candida] anglica TaxID=148631 RepID=A0ABP0EN36_9ASCO